jgi:hypothetical protein
MSHQKPERVAAQREASGGAVERDGFAFRGLEQVGLYVGTDAPLVVRQQARCLDVAGKSTHRGEVWISEAALIDPVYGQATSGMLF